MENQKGSVAIWVIVILIVMVVAGAVWYAHQQSPASQTHATTPMSVSATNGAAPLHVQFDSGVYDEKALYRIDFGDGQKSAALEVADFQCEPGPADKPIVVCPPYEVQSSHSYTSPGTYVATLLQNGQEVATTKAITVVGGSQPTCNLSVETRADAIVANWTSNHASAARLTLTEGTTTTFLSESVPLNGSRSVPVSTADVDFRLVVSNDANGLSSGCGYGFPGSKYY